MLNWRNTRALSGLAIATVIALSTRASADIPADPFAAALQPKTAERAEGKRPAVTHGTSAKRMVDRSGPEGLGQIAGDINDRMPSGSTTPSRRKVYDPDRARHAKVLIRRRPPGGSATAPAPGALPLAALGVALVLRLTRSFGGHVPH